MSKLEFKACTPGDVEKAVPLILMSGPQAFAYVFDNKKQSAHDFLSFAFQREGGQFTYENHFGVFSDRELIGIGAIFSAKRASGFTFRDFLNIVKFYRLGTVSILIRGLSIERILQLPKKNEICIAHLAVDEKERSKGFGEQLMKYLMDQVPTNASSSFVLDVSEENPRAHALYERIGFKVKKHVISTLKNKYGYVANHFRMELRQ